MLHDPKTVSRSDFDQETAEKIAPQFIARLELANCIYSYKFDFTLGPTKNIIVEPFINFYYLPLIVTFSAFNKTVLF